MKLLLALIIAYAATDIAYNRASLHKVMLYHTPQIVRCDYKPFITYGDYFSLAGYFEHPWCCIKRQHQVECR